jgi:hypothetical protein
MKPAAAAAGRKCGPPRNCLELLRALIQASSRWCDLPMPSPARLCRAAQRHDGSVRMRNAESRLQRRRPRGPRGGFVETRCRAIAGNAAPPVCVQRSLLTQATEVDGRAVITAITAMRRSRPCGDHGHAAITAMRRSRPCGDHGQVRCLRGDRSPHTPSRAAAQEVLWESDVTVTSFVTAGPQSRFVTQTRTWEAQARARH